MFRLGGDEFAILMLGCSAADLSLRMVRLEKYLQGQRLPGVPEPHDITVAWGVAEYTEREQLSRAYQDADAAMYQKKRSQKSETCKLMPIDQPPTLRRLTPKS